MKDDGRGAAAGREFFAKLAVAVMPYGKYAGRRLLDLPETYLIWMLEKANPGGELERMLRSVYEIKLNGLEHLFRDGGRIPPRSR